MNKRRAVVFAIILGGITAALAGWWFDRPQRQRASAKAGPAAGARMVPAAAAWQPAEDGWAPGLTYQHRARLRVTLGQGKESLARELSGRWTSQVVVPGGGGRGLKVSFTLDAPAAQTENGGGWQGLAAQLRLPFIIRYDLHGRALDLLFEAPPPRGEALRVLRQLANTFQITLPAQREREWTAIERDLSGEVKVSYQELGGGQFQRRATGHERVVSAEGLVVPGPGQAAPHIQRSQGLYQLDDRGRIKEAQVSLALSTSVSAAQDFTGDIETSFELLSGGQIEAAVSTRSFNRQVTLTGDAASFEEARRNALENQVAGGTVGSLLSDLRANQAPEQSEQSSLAEARLSALMLLDERAVTEAVATLGRGDVPPGLLGALATAGTPAAQAGLLAMATATGLAVEERQQAIQSMHAVMQPTPETAVGLETLAATAESPELKRDASYALGTALGRLGKDHRDRASSAIARLAAEYESSPEVEDRRRILSALGNSAMKEALPTVQRGLAAPELPVRLAALEALGQIAGPEADRILADRLLVRGSPEERAGALLAAARRKFVEPLAGALSTLLRTETDQRIRFRVLQVVGAYLRRDRNKAVVPLLDWVGQNDPDQQIRKAVAELLSDASDA